MIFRHLFCFMNFYMEIAWIDPRFLQIDRPICDLTRSQIGHDFPISVSARVQARILGGAGSGTHPWDGGTRAAGAGSFVL